MRRIVGIDPGNEGAIAFLSEDDEIHVYDIPTYTQRSSGSTKSKTYVDASALLSIMQDNPFQTAYLERVSSSPQMGVVGAFSFGENFGSLKMAVTACGGYCELVSPALWKKTLRVPKQKDGSVLRACNLFMGGREVFYGPRGGIKDGRAEACMIAFYGSLLEEWRTYNNCKYRVTFHG